MKIGIVTDTYLPRLGGGELYCYHLARFFQRNSFEVKIFTRLEGNINYSSFKDELRIKRVFWGRGIFSQLKFFWQMYNFLKDVDSIHAIYCHRFAAFAALSKIFNRKPLVITLEGLGILNFSGNDWYHAKINALYRWISLKGANKIIASSKEFEEIALRYVDQKKIAYLPNSVDLSKFDINKFSSERLERKYNNKKVILTVRRLVPKNGIQFLVESAPFIIQKTPEVKFVIVGWGWMEDYLKKRVKELRLGNYFDFAGRVENDQIVNYLTLADVVVFPSTAEATSIACIEAMAMKKAIVASKVGGYFDLIEDNKNGILVDLVGHQDSRYEAPMDLPVAVKQNFANAINKLLNDINLREQFGSASYKLVQKKFSWENNIKKIIKIHLDLLNK